MFFFKKKKKEDGNEKKKDIMEVLSSLKNKRVQILGKIFYIRGIKKIKGIKGFYFSRKIKKKEGVVTEDSYFLPFNYIMAYSGECLEDNKFMFINKKMSIKIYIAIYIYSFFVVSIGYFILLSVIMGIIAFAYYRNLFKIKFYISSDGSELDGVLNFVFEDHESVCDVLKVLEYYNIKGRNIIIRQKAELNKIFKVMFKDSVNDIKKEIAEIDKKIKKRNKK
ncbi:MAG: hypothetical protein GXO50_04175 [Chlorobi bacterium]|nr:hypothetical protein [Chlorobiota bacterium]